MKILLIGDASSEYNPIFSYEREFGALGHQVKKINIKDFFRLTLWNRALNKLFFRVPVYFGVGRLNREILGQAGLFEPELVIFLEPHHIKPSTVLTLKESGSIVFARNDDAVFRPKNGSTLFYKILPLLNCIISMNSNNVLELRRRGLKRVEFVPLAVDKVIRYPVLPKNEEERMRIGADIVFIGTYANEDRVGFLEKLSLDGYDIKVYGNSWQKARGVSSLKGRGAIMYKPVVGEEMSKVMNSSKIVLAFLRHHNRDEQTVRTYEIPACGAFMLHERTKEAMELFREGVEAEFFDSYEELKKKIDYYLGHPEERQRIAKSGYDKATTPEYSYADRTKKLLSIYESTRSGS